MLEVAICLCVTDSLRSLVSLHNRPAR